MFVMSAVASFISFLRFRLTFRSPRENLVSSTTQSGSKNGGSSSSTPTTSMSNTAFSSVKKEVSSTTARPKESSGSVSITLFKYWVCVSPINMLIALVLNALSQFIRNSETIFRLFRACYLFDAHTEQCVVATSKRRVGFDCFSLRSSVDHPLQQIEAFVDEASCDGLLHSHGWDSFFRKQIQWRAATDAKRVSANFV